jgi:hypothetical protein
LTGGKKKKQHETTSDLLFSEDLSKFLCLKSGHGEEVMTIELTSAVRQDMEIRYEGLGRNLIW